MNQKKQTKIVTPSRAAAPVSRPPKKKKGTLGRIVRRFFLCLFAFLIMLLSALVMMLNLIFNGPSPAARDLLTMSLLEPSATKWIPGLFLSDDVIQSIRTSDAAELSSDVTDTSAIVIQKDSLISGSDEWVEFPEGIRIEHINGDGYKAHVMLVRDPARVYLGISNEDGFTTSVPGKRLTEVMEESDVIAAINAGAFNDDGSTSSRVGSVPEGLVYSEGVCVWKTGAPPNDSGFAGFNKDNVLVVHKENISQSQAESLNIRDGCCFGPVLIMNGEVNLEAYAVSGQNPRTAIGQRSDGTVIFVCIDGRQPGAFGGTYADMINIMQEYGAVNACNMDGGSSTVMMYRDTEGRYGEKGQVQMVNNYSLLQSEPRRMPDYWLVRPAGEE